MSSYFPWLFKLLSFEVVHVTSSAQVLLWKFAWLRQALPSDTAIALLDAGELLDFEADSGLLRRLRDLKKDVFFKTFL